jgi:hypothetical protein
MEPFSLQSQNFPKMALSKQDDIFMSLDVPPSYEETQRDFAWASNGVNAPLPSLQLQLQPVQSSFKPIVIPRRFKQTSLLYGQSLTSQETFKSFCGAFFSPFNRAYSPVLEPHSISTSDFLFFLDGLNEPLSPPRLSK